MTERRGVAVIAVTRAGSTLAERLAAYLPDARAYLPDRYASGSAVIAYTGPVADLTASLFSSATGIVFVLAAGAVVRLVAPHLRDKRVDPAVVCVDDAGRFAIALLSGHAGGANALATDVASAIGATSVITTASESHGLPVADLIGQPFGWRIEHPEGLKALAAALVNGDRVALLQEAGEPDWHDAPLPAWVTRYLDMPSLVAANPPTAIIISDRIHGAAERTGWVTYRPRSLALGIGCSRGVSEQEIAALVDQTLAAHDLSPGSAAAVASVDLKADEAGLLAFVHQRGLELHVYPARVLDSVPNQAHSSVIVKAAVGTRGVCEPAALLLAGATQLLVPKQKSRMATVAVARRVFAAETEE